MDRRDFLKTSLLGTAALGITGITGFTGCRAGIRNSFDTIIKNGAIYAGDGRAPVM